MRKTIIFIALLFCFIAAVAWAQTYNGVNYRSHSQVVTYTVTAGGSEILYFDRTVIMPSIQVAPGGGGTAAVLYTCVADVSSAAAGDWEDSGFGEIDVVKTIWVETPITGIKLTATTADAEFRIIL